MGTNSNINQKKTVTYKYEIKKSISPDQAKSGSWKPRKDGSFQRRVPSSPVKSTPSTPKPSSGSSGSSSPPKSPNYEITLKPKSMTREQAEKEGFKHSGAIGHHKISATIKNIDTAKKYTSGLKEYYSRIAIKEEQSEDLNKKYLIGGREVTRTQYLSELSSINTKLSNQLHDLDNIGTAPAIGVRAPEEKKIQVFSKKEFDTLDQGEVSLPNARIREDIQKDIMRMQGTRTDIQPVIKLPDFDPKARFKEEYVDEKAEYEAAKFHQKAAYHLGTLASSYGREYFGAAVGLRNPDIDSKEDVVLKRIRQGKDLKDIGKKMDILQAKVKKLHVEEGYEEESKRLREKWNKLKKEEMKHYITNMVDNPGVDAGIVLATGSAAAGAKGVIGAAIRHPVTLGVTGAMAAAEGSDIYLQYRSGEQATAAGRAMSLGVGVGVLGGYGAVRYLKRPGVGKIVSLESKADLATLSGGTTKRGSVVGRYEAKIAKLNKQDEIINRMITKMNSKIADKQMREPVINIEKFVIGSEVKTKGRRIRMKTRVVESETGKFTGYDVSAKIGKPKTTVLGRKELMRIERQGIEESLVADIGKQEANVNMKIRKITKNMNEPSKYAYQKVESKYDRLTRTTKHKDVLTGDVEKQITAERIKIRSKTRDSVLNLEKSLMDIERMTVSQKPPKGKMSFPEIQTHKFSVLDSKAHKKIKLSGLDYKKMKPLKNKFTYPEEPGPMKPLVFDEGMNVPTGKGASLRMRRIGSSKGGTAVKQIQAPKQDIMQAAQKEVLKMHQQAMINTRSTGRVSMRAPQIAGVMQAIGTRTKSRQREKTIAMSRIKPRIMQENRIGSMERIIPRDITRFRRIDGVIQKQEQKQFQIPDTDTIQGIKTEAMPDILPTPDIVTEPVIIPNVKIPTPRLIRLPGGSREFRLSHVNIRAKLRTKNRVIERKFADLTKLLWR